MRTLMSLTLLPLAVIGLQHALGLSGMWGYVPYKVCFLVPPLIYCHRHGINPWQDILRFRDWRRGLPQAVVLGLLAAAVFLAADRWLADLLIDKASLIPKMKQQFGVTARTVLLVAPWTMLPNSLLEEFFYRGFSFGLLRRNHRAVAYLLPATAFTAQHLLFIHDWFSPLPLAIAGTALFVLALVLSDLYRRAGTLVAPWVVHFWGDLVMMWIAAQMLL